MDAKATRKWRPDLDTEKGKVGGSVAMAVPNSSRQEVKECISDAVPPLSGRWRSLWSSREALSGGQQVFLYAVSDEENYSKLCFQ